MNSVFEFVLVFAAVMTGGVLVVAIVVAQLRKYSQARRLRQHFSSKKSGRSPDAVVIDP